MSTEHDLSKHSQRSKSEKKRSVRGKLSALETPEIFVCPKCKTSNATDARFCEECGSALVETNSCPQCGRSIEVGANVCESCGTWLAGRACGSCGNDVARGEKFCPYCGKELMETRCPKCGRPGVASFCPHCSTPLTERAKQAVQQLNIQKEKEAFSTLADDIKTLRIQTEPAEEQTALERRREREQMEALDKILKSAMAEKKPAIGTQQKQKHSSLFSIEERELLHKKNELRQMIETQSKMTFATPKEAREYFHAVRPPNALGWVCNYKNTIHPSPDGCAHPEHGGHWEMFTDIRWVSTTEDV